MLNTRIPVVFSALCYVESKPSAECHRNFVCVGTCKAFSDCLGRAIPLDVTVADTCSAFNET
jgi:hypothetical protein